jgi:hypothetical protein
VRENALFGDSVDEKNETRGEAKREGGGGGGGGGGRSEREAEERIG